MRPRLNAWPHLFVRRMGAAAILPERTPILSRFHRLSGFFANIFPALKPGAEAILFWFFLPAGIFFFFRRSQGKIDGESTALSRLALNRDSAVKIIFDYFFDDAKAEADILAVFRFGGEEDIENFMQMFRRNADAAVFNGD